MAPQSVFANLDGLNDYDEDFTDAATVLSEIKTAYKVGKGMVGDESEETTAAPETEEPAGAEGEVAPEPAEPQRIASPEDGPTLAEANMNPSADSIASDDKDEPVPVGESLPRPEEDGAAVDAVLRKPAAPPRRSAAARRWGESSE